MALREGNEADAVVADQERPVPAPRPRKTIVNIQPFTGKDSEDITEWLINWDIAAVANGWTEENQVQLIPADLSGRSVVRLETLNIGALQGAIKIGAV